MRVVPTCLPAAASATTGARALAAWERPFRAIRARGLSFACRKVAKRVDPAAEQLPEDLWVDDGCTGGDIFDRADDVGDVLAGEDFSAVSKVGMEA